MILRSVVFIAQLILLTACGPETSNIKKDNTTNGALSDWRTGFPVKIPKNDKSVVYVLYEKGANNHWIIVEASYSPLSHTLPGQEQLKISADNKKATPAYARIHVSRAGTTFVCSEGGYLSDAHKREAYNGCNSSLIEQSVTLERLWGETIYVKIDPEKIKQLIDETNTLELINSCLQQKQALAEYRSKIRIKYQYKDKSGYYDQAPLTRVGISLPKATCPMNLNEARYTVKITKGYNDYEVDIKPDTFVINYGDPKSIVTSNITVKSKKFNSLTINDQFSNKDLSIAIDKIKYDRGTAVFYYQLENKTQKHLSVSSLSFYINNNILTESFSAPIKLPPISVKGQLKGSFDSHHPNIQGGNMNQVRMSIVGNFNKKMAKSLRVSIGVSAEYSIQNKIETLFSKRKFTYNDVIEIN